MTASATSAPAEPAARVAHPDPRAALAASVLGFFVVTLDAAVVNVALPSIRADLDGALAGLQWVVDGYTLMFAALLLTAGALTDRWGARTALGIGIGVGIFVLASAACALAPAVAVLVAARFVQGAGAAVTMPASMALVRHAYDEPARRARAVGIWSMGAAVAAGSGPVVGGLLSLTSWRLIFVLNLPVGVVTLLLLARAPESPQHAHPLDWPGQILAMLALTGLTYGAIEAGSLGLTAPRVLTAVALSLAAALAFVARERRGSHPMLPLELFTSRTMKITAAVGFAFMVCFYGLPFLYSLQLQQIRGLSSLAAGLVFLPMLALSGALTPLSAPVVEYVGARASIVTGLTLMAVGSIALTVVPGVGPGLGHRGPAAAGRARRPAGDAPDHRAPAGRRPRAASRDRQRRLQHQPSDRRRPGRGRVRCPARLVRRVRPRPSPQSDHRRARRRRRRGHRRTAHDSNTQRTGDVMIDAWSSQELDGLG